MLGIFNNELIDSSDDLKEKKYKQFWTSQNWNLQSLKKKWPRRHCGPVRVSKGEQRIQTENCSRLTTKRGKRVHVTAFTSGRLKTGRRRTRALSDLVDPLARPAASVRNFTDPHPSIRAATSTRTGERAGGGFRTCRKLPAETLSGPQRTHNK